MLHVDSIKAVIFDLGRVLVRLDFTRGLFRYYKKDEDTSVEEVIEELYRDKLFVDFNTGRIGANELYRRIVDIYQLNLNYDQFVYEWCNIFAPMPGMPEIVKRVSKKYPIGLLSDIDPLHWQYCRENFSFLSYFKNPALSFEIGALKPDPVCFLKAAENMKVDPVHCLFIDDREINVAGARKVGMQAIQFTGVDDLLKLLPELSV
jgi:putative hydrolase of the HAD superfamily